MIEEIVIAYLNANLTVHVGGEVPNRPPLRYVVVQKKGGERENHIYTALFQFDAYAESLVAAAALCKEVMAVVDEMTDLDEVCSCEYGGDFNATDTASKRYRYQAMYNITHY